MSEAPTPAANPLDGFTALFATLIPPDRITLKDVSGTVHEAVPVLPALLELELVQTLAKISDIKAGADIKAKVMELGAAKGKDQVGAMLGLASTLIRENAAILDIVSEAFELAYPEAVEAAVTAVRQKRPRLLAKVQGEPRAHHVFDIGELIGGLLPFGARIVATIREKITNLQAPTT
jgi:hypothetical protein